MYNWLTCEKHHSDEQLTLCRTLCDGNMLQEKQQSPYSESKTMRAQKLLQIVYKSCCIQLFFVSTNSLGQLDVFSHNCHSLGVDCQQTVNEKKGFTKEPMRHKALFCEKVNGKMSKGTDVYFTMASTVANATMTIFIPMSQI
jgi:hypothetical protein